MAAYGGMQHNAGHFIFPINHKMATIIILY